MTIKFRKKGQAEWVMAYILVVSMLQLAFNNIAVIKYTIDVAWCFLLIMMVTRRLPRPGRAVYGLMLIAGLFFTFTIFGLVLNYQSMLYYLWGIRNNIRFFVFFAACTVILREAWIEGYLDLFDKLFWINFPIVLFQYFVLGYSGDYLGGIFGVIKTCNAYMNVFLMIVLSKSIVQSMHKQEKISMCLLKCAIALMITILSEIKIMIIEVGIIVLLAAMMIRFTMRKTMIILAAVAGIFASANAIARLFPSFEGWFSIANILEIATAEAGYTGRNDLNRLTAVPEIMDRFLTSGTDKIFGLGLGNCDYASFAFLKTPFYQKYTSLHYYWFSSAFMLLETGILGTILYLSFYGAVFAAAHWMEKKQRADVIYCQMAKIMVVMSILTFFYNSALRIEAGFMVFFVLALPFVRRNGSSVKRVTVTNRAYEGGLISR